MDQESGEDFYKLLSRLNMNRGLTVLMVSHDVERICDHVSQIYCLEHHAMAVLTPEQVRQGEGRHGRRPERREHICDYI